MLCSTVALYGADSLQEDVKEPTSFVADNTWDTASAMSKLVVVLAGVAGMQAGGHSCAAHTRWKRHLCERGGQVQAVLLWRELTMSFVTSKVQSAAYGTQNHKKCRDI